MSTCDGHQRVWRCHGEGYAACNIIKHDRFGSESAMAWGGVSLEGRTIIHTMANSTLTAVRFDSGKDGFIDLMELKMMMQKLGAPQTHLGLKTMIREVDKDYDGKLSYREFLLIFRRAAAGELQESGLMALARLSEINVSDEGVQSACDFFEAKAQVLSVRSKFEAELCEEQEEKRRVEEERKQRHVAFKELQSAFCS
ncbi:EF-hand domain-containing protein D1 isoform X2 [Electrophorus electricus]|uniref:EF-hand domain-containing protein D1 isoform X2 n=1 Tax=Electrophorus electricus TaxID=8005 RepID=UPI0015D00DDD|nr:EF-hand domain-containing protein D1 isoform X2 [Electrophorus electricus]